MKEVEQFKRVGLKPLKYIPNLYEEVRDAIEEAIKRCREGNGYYIIAQQVKYLTKD